jgi:hypothetical protein
MPTRTSAPKITRFDHAMSAERHVGIRRKRLVRLGLLGRIAVGGQQPKLDVFGPLGTPQRGFPDYLVRGVLKLPLEIGSVLGSEVVGRILATGIGHGCERTALSTSSLRTRLEQRRTSEQ